MPLCVTKKRQEKKVKYTRINTYTQLHNKGLFAKANSRTVSWKVSKIETQVQYNRIKYQHKQTVYMYEFKKKLEQVLYTITINN